MEVVHAVVTIGVLVVVFGAERVSAAFPLPTGANDGGLARWGRNTILAVLVLTVTFVVLVPAKHWAVEHQLWEWPHRLPVGLTAVATIVVLDLVDYGYHRAAHVTALWRFHQVHHLDEAYDSTTTLRIHPVDMCLGGLAHLPVVFLLGLPIEGIVAYTAVFFPVAVFHHTNLRLPARGLRALSTVLVTPPYHMTHHEQSVADTNSNYASILTVWDRVFGSDNPARRDAGWRMGVDYSRDRSWRGLLALPFARTQQYSTDVRDRQRPNLSTAEVPRKHPTT